MKLKWKLSIGAFALLAFVIVVVTQLRLGADCDQESNEITLHWEQREPQDTSENVGSADLHLPVAKPKLESKARRKAESSGLMAFRDDFNDLISDDFGDGFGDDYKRSYDYDYGYSGDLSIEKTRDKQRRKVKSIDDLLEELDFGNLAFNTPSKINIDDAPEIQLLLSKTKTIEQLKRSIAEEGKKVGATIQVSDRMEARLTGRMFQITAITPEIQVVSKRQDTEWKWEIHPKQDGNHDLHLTIAVLLEIEGHSTAGAIRTFDRTIEVEVTNKQTTLKFISNNWQWILMGIIVPIAGWYCKKKFT